MSGEGEPELEGVETEGGGVREAAAADVRNPADSCGGHWPCHRPRFRAPKPGR